MKTYLCMAVILVAAMPPAALAQPPDPPRVEVSAQAAIQIEQERARAWSPRITLNLTPQSAIEATADFRPERQLSFGTRISSQAYSLQWRQSLFSSGRWQVFGVLGAGGGRLVQDIPEQVYPGRDGPQVFPAFTYVDSGFAAHLGPAVQFEIAPWLALRGDVRLTAGHSSGLRGLIGAAVPIGRFRAGDRPTGPTPPLAAWGRVKPGREVWVTTAAGAMIHGEVAAISDSSVRIRKQRDEVSVNLDEVRLVEGRDSLKNGIIIGGASGAVSGAALLAWAASVLCETDSCDQIEVVAIAMGAASGAVIGGLIGGMVDGIIPGRQTLYEKTGIRVSPVLSPRTRALDITIRWR